MRMALSKSVCLGRAISFLQLPRKSNSPLSLLGRRVNSDSRVAHICLPLANVGRGLSPQGVGVFPVEAPRFSVVEKAPSYPMALAMVVLGQSPIGATPS